MKLSGPMIRRMLRRQGSGNTETRKALFRRGLLTEGGGYTDKGLAFVKSYFVNDFPIEAKIIDRIEDLITAYQGTDDASIYVYRGQTPMLVERGDGQNPIAYIDKYLNWRMQHGLIDHPFQFQEIIGHKGSYGFYLAPSPNTNGQHGR